MLFQPSDLEAVNRDPQRMRRVMRLLFEGRLPQEQMAEARGILLDMTAFYSALSPEQMTPPRDPVAVLEAKRIMAQIIELTRYSIGELDAIELQDEGSEDL